MRVTPVKDAPARLRVGPAVRHFSAPVTSSRGPAAFRETTTPTPPALTEAHQAALASIQFTMRSNRYLYSGGEVETGVLDTPGSSAAGVYGLVGASLPLLGGTLAGELVGGYRTVRYAIDTPDIGSLVLEPRLRGEVWISPRLTLEASTGFTVGDQRVWLVGVGLGIHSHDFGVR